MSSPAARLVEVVTELLVEQGFEGISVRKVATRAGVSIGAVQHHFPTKDAMLTAAMDRAAERFQEQIDRRITVDAAPGEILRTVALGLLATEPGADVGTVLWVARLARAAVDPATATTHAREWSQIAELLEGLLAAAVPELPAGRVADEAAMLLALLDGLAVSVLREPERMPAERAERLLDAHLARLMPD